MAAPEAKLSTIAGLCRSCRHQVNLQLCLLPASVLPANMDYPVPLGFLPPEENPGDEWRRFDVRFLSPSQ